MTSHSGGWQTTKKAVAPKPKAALKAGYVYFFYLCNMGNKAILYNMLYFNISHTFYYMTGNRMHTQVAS